MFGLMLIGLAWIIVFYVSQGTLPVPAQPVEHPHRLRDPLRGISDDHALALTAPQHGGNYTAVIIPNVEKPVDNSRVMLR